MQASCAGADFPSKKTSRVLAHISFVLCELSSWGQTKMLEIKREIKRSRIAFGGYPTIGPRDGGGRDLEPGPQKTAFHPSHVQKMPLASLGIDLIQPGRFSYGIELLLFQTGFRPFLILLKVCF